MTILWLLPSTVFTIWLCLYNVSNCRLGKASKYSMRLSLKSMFLRDVRFDISQLIYVILFPLKSSCSSSVLNSKTFCGKSVSSQYDRFKLTNFVLLRNNTINVSFLAIPNLLLDKSSFFRYSWLRKVFLPIHSILLFDISRYVR